MRILNRFVILGTLFICLSSSQAIAQNLNVQSFNPAVGPDAIFSVEGAKTVGHLKPTGGVVLNYTSRSLVQTFEDGSEIPIVDQQLATHLLFGFGVTDFLQLDLHLPLYIINDGRQLDGTEFSGFTLGDANIRPKAHLFNIEGDGLAIDVGLMVDVSLPLGDDEAYTGSGGVRVLPKLTSGLSVGIVKFALNVGVDIFESKTVGDLEVSNALAYGAGAEVSVLNGLLLFGGELYGKTSFSDFAQKESSPLEGIVGAKLISNIGGHVMAGGGGGLIPGYGAPDFRAFVGFGWAPRNSDFDGDGIENSADACVEEPEDFDGFEDEDGCPEFDNDGDGISDEDDGCPDDAEDLDAFEDEDGCPDTDNDADTILDEADKCPNDAEDMNGFQDEDGCPDGTEDSDGDGIPNATDKCPDKPEDKDNFQDDDGCPDLDNDNDGIMDPDDKCPNEPGLKADDGCPPAETKAVLKKDTIQILEKVFFESDKSIIKSESYNLLDQVSLILRTNPQVTQLEIGGHTDDKGKDEYNQQLSEARAKAVQNYLIGKGIQSERLSAVGYGEAKPIESAKTKAGRAKNRRVEFKIITKPAQAPK